MTHTNYYKVDAASHFDLGSRLGYLFKPSFKNRFSNHGKQSVSFEDEYLQIVTQHFPEFIEEMRGYAQSIGIDFRIYWRIYLNLDLSKTIEKCTSCFSRDGLIIGHNEDNYEFLSEHIALLQKSINGVSIFELHYYNSLGGDACSINSHGYVQTINTLHQSGNSLGVPRNIIARWLSETQNPQSDFIKLQSMKRDLGYSHTFGNVKGKVLNIESTSNNAHLVRPKLPYVHTNHYLTSLAKYEARLNTGNSHERYQFASSHLLNVETAQDMMSLLEQVSLLPSNNYRESKTIARMVFDLKRKEVWGWLEREKSKGWICYPIQFL